MDFSQTRLYCSIIRGVSYKKNEGIHEPQIGYVPILRATNINKELNYLNLVYVPSSKLKEEQYVKELDIIIAMSSGSKNLVGKAAQAKHNFLGGFGAFCGLIRVNPKLNKKFIGYFFQSNAYNKSISQLSSGVNINNLRRENVLSIKLSLPPLPEQHRIVDKIEELFTRLDAGIESLKKVQAQIKRYRKAVLKHAFEGGLTAQWRKKNATKSADALLLRIREERQIDHVYSKKNSRLKSSQIKDDEFDDLPTIPDSWKWVKLGSIAEKIQIGPFGSLLHKDDYIVSGIPLINPIHIKNLSVFPDNNLTISSSKAYELENYVLAAGDIIMARRGEMGRCAVITKKEDGYICGTGCLFIRLPSLLSSKFYSLILSSERVRHFLNSNCLGTTMKNLNQGIIKDIPVPLFSLEEQLQIVEEIERRFSIADRIEEIVEQNLKKAERLRQSILKKAFEGRLVPQDPTDEPASVLLERIKAEKEKYASKKDQRRRSKK